jgi:hypothetical protein
VFLSGAFQRSFDDAAQEENFTQVDVSEIYEMAKIAFLTGWTIEYIKELSWLNHEAILQIHQAENNLRAKNGRPSRFP